MATLPPAGTSAPDFTLPSTSGKAVTLSKLRGQNVLLAFFPEVFTRVCTAEMCALSDDYSEFEGNDTVVLPISTDSVGRLQEFKAGEGLRVDLLSDAGQEVSREYGTLLKGSSRSNRAYVLIDRDGIIRWAHAEKNPGSRRENAEIIEQIRKLN